MTETFYATQQVEDPNGQGRPASRNRVLRGSGATPAAKRTQGALLIRVIEPRNRSDRGSRRRDVCGRHHRRRRDWPGAGGSTGVGERGMRAGVAQEVREVSPSPPETRGRRGRWASRRWRTRVLQRAVLMALEPVFEEDFLSCSCGFRPGRGPHMALEALWRGLMSMGGGWVIYLDIRSFFDEVDRGHLRDFPGRRVRDGVIRRAVGDWCRRGHHLLGGDAVGGAAAQAAGPLRLPRHHRQPPGAGALPRAGSRDMAQVAVPSLAAQPADADSVRPAGRTLSAALAVCRAQRLSCS